MLSAIAGTNLMATLETSMSSRLTYKFAHTYAQLQNEYVNIELFHVTLNTCGYKKRSYKK